MSHFLQLHLLTCYPPANLNRDDLGRPKTCTVGGVERLRVSSQSLKRAWRTSTLFRETVADPCGIRTKRMGVLMYRALVEGRTLVDQMAIEETGNENPPDGTLRRLDDNQAAAVTKAVAAVFGKLSGAGEQPDDDEADAAEASQTPETDSDDAEQEEAVEPETPESDLELKQLAHFSREEIRAVSERLERVRNGEAVPSENELKRELLRTGHSAADIAMFGRFFADKREFTVEAAVQVAHAFGVQRATISDDFFTAVDDLNRRDVSGAGHMDVNEFDSGLFYLYICVDRDLLLQNLAGNQGLRERALRGLVACAAQIAPIGKQASFASRAYASYILAEKGDYQPRSLAVAYLEPLVGPSLLQRSIEALKDTSGRMNTAYRQTWSTSELDTLQGNGTLAELAQFVAE